MEDPQERRRSQRARLASWLMLVVGALAGVAYVAGPPPVSGLAFLAVGTLACAALVGGLSLHRPRPRAPWALFTVACALFLVGAVVRPWAGGQRGPAMAVADLFTVPGYLLLIAGIVVLLRARGSLERHAVADGLIVSLGAGLWSVMLFALPAAGIEGRPRWFSLLAALYPVFDIVLLLALVNLAFTTAARHRSFQLVVAAMVALIVGDLGYAAIGATGSLIGSPLLDVPFFVAYTLFGAGALHPSMTGLGRAAPRRAQPWSWRRVALLVPALTTPPLLMALLDAPSAPLRIAVGAAAAGMVAALVVRAVSAVEAHSRAQEVFHHQATHDALTGLPNRVLLLEHLTRLLSGRRRDAPSVWLLFLDLDEFKLVNDTWGHDAGDGLIVQAAERLRGAVPGEAVVGRLGGDEFVVCVETGADEAARLADLVIGTFYAPFRVGGTDLVVHASLGMASARQPGAAETLMRDADTAMYHAKRQGRNRWVVFDSTMRDSVRGRVETELALRHAVARGQLTIHYQPIVELATSRPVGAEALLRWLHPVRGPIEPAEFIPVAEDTGLVAEVGEWVADEALTQLAAWRASGVVDDGFFMSVNVSTRQLRDGRLQGALARDLDRLGLPGCALVLEITESVMLEDSEVTAEVLQGLRGLGVRLSVDDFGTGYSALGYLRRFPVTGVKIDRSFVAGLGGAGDDEEIVRAITAMGHALGLSVVAEGVETREQRDALVLLGVDLAQGWWHGRPVDPQTFVRTFPVAPARIPAPRVGVGQAGEGIS